MFAIIHFSLISFAQYPKPGGLMCMKLKILRVQVFFVLLGYTPESLCNRYPTFDWTLTPWRWDN